MSHQRQLVVVPGGAISFAHTLLAGSAFGGAFVLACLFHFKDVCKNAVAGACSAKEGCRCDHTVTDRACLASGFPVEWFPSVSATLVDLDFG
jgi:hypothetical protein